MHDVFSALSSGNLFPSVLHAPAVVSDSVDGDRETGRCVALRTGVSLWVCPVILVTQLQQKKHCVAYFTVFTVFLESDKNIFRLNWEMT